MSEPQNESDARDVMKGPPSGYFVVVPQHGSEDAVDLAYVLSIIVQSWKLLFATAFIAAAITAVVSLQMRKVYRAEAVVAPSQGTGSAGALRQLGGLAALAGIDLSSGGGRKEEAYATLVSNGFARDFILRENLMPVLFEERWDASTKQWRVGEKEPTLDTGVRKFVTSVRSIKEDRKTGLVTVGIEWYSPELAAQWANRMVEHVNERLRAQATKDARQSIDYLNKELQKANVIELRQAIFGLIETQVNNAMLANVQREYAYRFIDPAVPPEIRTRPKRTIMVFVGGAAGLFLGLIWVFTRRFIGRPPASVRS